MVMGGALIYQITIKGYSKSSYDYENSSQDLASFYR
jgi:hypothetical protein